MPYRLPGEGPLDDGNTCDRMGDQSHTIESEEDCCDSRRAHIRGQEKICFNMDLLTAFRVHLVYNGPTLANNKKLSFRLISIPIIY